MLASLLYFFEYLHVFFNRRLKASSAKPTNSSFDQSFDFDFHSSTLDNMDLPASEIQYQQAHITDNATNSIIAANVACSLVAGSAVVLRITSRRLKKLSLGIDDYMAMLALVRFTV